MASVTERATSSNDAINSEKAEHLARTTTAVTISPELFEKLYLQPKTPHPGDLNKRFANATPLGFLGFVLSASTFAMVLMGWGGAAGLQGVAGIFFFTGPVLLILATVFSWVQNNFFPMMVCGLFSVFWLSFGVLQVPSWGLAAAYSASGTDTAEGLASREYNAVIALYLVVWGFALFTFWIFTLRINAVFAAIFGLTSTGVWILSGAYWKVSTGNYATAGTLQKAGGAVIFVVSLLGWYMLFVQMAAEMRLTVNLPVGDLSHFFNRTDVEIGEVEKSD